MANKFMLVTSVYIFDNNNPYYYLSFKLTFGEDFSFSNKQWVIITIYGTSFTRVIDTYLKLKKQIAPFWELKVGYEKKIEQAIYKSKQQEKH